MDDERTRHAGRDEAPEDPGAGAEVWPTERELALERIVTEFLLRREEGEEPTIEEYRTRYPRYAEELFFLLSEHAGATPRRGSESPPAASQEGPSLPRIGAYEVLETVARGGGGTVHRARHHVEHHVVALKVLERSLLTDPRDLERLAREARLLRALDLVNIVPVYEVGEDRGRHFVAMKWIEGETLARLRDSVGDPRHRLHRLPERARLIARVARAFEAIHGCGILHRDVKPSNILIDRIGEPVIIDFGIARAPDAGDLTQTLDGVLGTPRYLAPELILGGNLDVSVRSDIYGLGLCLYELVCGVVPFVQRTRADLFHQITHGGPLHPRRAQPAVPHELAAIILRAIEIDPRRRYPSMGELADDLERFAEGRPPSAQTLRRAHPAVRFYVRHRRIAVPALCLLVLVVLAGSAWLGREWRIAERRRELEAVVGPFVLAPPELFPLQGEAICRAARELVELGAEDATTELQAAWIHFLAGDPTGAVELLGPANDGDPSSCRLLRGYIDLFLQKDGTAGGEQVLTLSTRPRLVNDEGKGLGDPFPMEIMDARELEPEDDRLRRRLRPPPLDHVRKLLGAPEDRVTEASEAMLRALLLWHSLPSALPADLASELPRCVIEEAGRALAIDPGQIWARYLRGAARIRLRQFAEASEDLAIVAGARPELPGVLVLHAVANASPFAPAGDPGLASQTFARASERLATLMREGRLPRRGLAAEERVRKLHAAWAWHEAHRGEREAMDEALRRWAGAIEAPLWQDRLMPCLIRARIHERAGETELALDCLEEAHRLHRTLALPLREEARLLQERLGDVAGARDRLARAARCPQQLPSSIEGWIAGNLFGIRPFSPKIVFATAFEPLRDGVPVEETGPVAPPNGR